MSRRITVAVVSVLIGIHLYLGWSFIRASAPTYDEPVHLSSGYSYLATGKYRLNVMDHPPLAEMVSAVPLLLKNIRLFSGHPYYVAGKVYAYGNLFLYKNTLDAEKMLNSSRFFSLLVWTALLAFFIWNWSAAAGGEGAALWAVFFLAFSPVFISNDSLVTTDAGSAVFYFISFFFAYLAFYGPESINPKSASRIPHSALSTPRSPLRIPNSAFLCFLSSGVFTGLAMSSKFNMFVVPPMVAGLVVFENFRKKRFGRAQITVYLAIYVLASFAVLAAAYRFRQAGLYFEGLSATFSRLDEGRSSFIMGTRSVAGIWWYFPAALAVKTPLAFLMLAGAGLAAFGEKAKRGYLWIVIPPALYLAAALLAKVQIGYRHILPVYPFLAVFAGLGAQSLSRKKGVFKLIPAALSLWMIVSVLRVHPHYLAYFNEAAGGPSNGYKVLSDSNLDWGQGIKELSRFLGKEGNPPLILSYFGSADPSYYGLRFVPLAPVTHAEIQAEAEDTSKWDRILLAVSATNLQSTYYPDKHVFDWLKARKPLYVAGYSIFLYDLTKDREGLVELAGVFDKAGLNEESRKLFIRAGKS